MVLLLNFAVRLCSLYIYMANIVSSLANQNLACTNLKVFVQCVLCLCYKTKNCLNKMHSGRFASAMIISAAKLTLYSFCILNYMIYDKGIK
jgi:hypothetical protein